MDSVDQVIEFPIEQLPNHSKLPRHATAIFNDAESIQTFTNATSVAFFELDNCDSSTEQPSTPITDVETLVSILQIPDTLCEGVYMALSKPSEQHPIAYETLPNVVSASHPTILFDGTSTILNEKLAIMETVPDVQGMPLLILTNSF
jgi:hypothetical protein